MRFDINTYLTELRCELVDQELIVEGFVFKCFKQLKFTPSTIVSTKFRQKEVKGTLIRFTKTKAIISWNGIEKRDDLKDFVMNNRTTECCFRIEKDGFGPYRSPNPTPELIQWRKYQKLKMDQQRDNDLKITQPSPSEDFGLSLYNNLPFYTNFAFKDYDQLFNWFSLEDIQFLIKQGFSIVSKQKGLDYYESFGSSAQIAYCRNEEDYRNIMRSERSYY